MSFRGTRNHTSNSAKKSNHKVCHSEERGITQVTPQRKANLYRFPSVISPFGRNDKLDEVHNAKKGFLKYFRKPFYIVKFVRIREIRVLIQIEIINNLASLFFGSVGAGVPFGIHSGNSRLV